MEEEKNINNQKASPISFVMDYEKKKYIIIYYAQIDDEDIKSFEVLEGRTKTRDWIKDMAEYLDINNSKVLTDGVKYDDSLSVYDFMKAMEQYFQDGFDIEDHIGGYEI